LGVPGDESIGRMELQTLCRHEIVKLEQHAPLSEVAILDDQVLSAFRCRICSMPDLLTYTGEPPIAFAMSVIDAVEADGSVQSRSKKVPFSGSVSEKGEHLRYQGIRCSRQKRLGFFIALRRFPRR
jgi:hypothetical protein